MQRFTIRSSGKTYSIEAKTESEAIRRLILEQRMDPRKLSSIKAENLNDESNITFVAQVGPRDYTCEASCERDALRAFALMGLNMSRLSNLRRR